MDTKVVLFIFIFIIIISSVNIKPTRHRIGFSLAWDWQQNCQFVFLYHTDIIEDNILSLGQKYKVMGNCIVFSSHH